MASTLESVAKLPRILVFRRAEFQVVGFVGCCIFETYSKFSRTFSGRRYTTAQVESTHVHVLLVPHRDLKFVEVEKRDGNGGQLIKEREELGLLVGFTRKFDSNFNPVLSTSFHGGSIFRGRSVEEVESYFIEPSSAKISGSVRVKWNGCVGVNVMLRTEGGLELTNRLQCFFEVQHRVPTGDTGAGRLHRMAFFNDFFP